MKVIDKREVFSVTELNQMAAQTLEKIKVWVEGEVFEVKYKEGQYRYVYFYLKDPQTEYQLPCLADPKYILSLDFLLEQGSKIMAYGQLGLYPKGGKYQFYASIVEPYGLGELLKRLEQLKAKLQKEGLFSDQYKISLPEYPVKIGVITSVVGAAWQDFKKQSADKFPFLELTLRDVLVQGPLAPQDICRAIVQLDRMGLDVIVVTRGGGSLEDLMAFNSEDVARAIFACRTPVISAVGHESDISIADLIADVRASTPTNAAELLIHNYHLLFQKIDYLHSQLNQKVVRYVRDFFQHLDYLNSRISLVENKYRYLPQTLKNLEIRLNMRQRDLIWDRSQFLEHVYEYFVRYGGAIVIHQNKLQSILDKLQLLSPTLILQRGYSIVKKGTHVIKTVSQLGVGDQVSVQLHRGQFTSLVTTTHG